MYKRQIYYFMKKAVLKKKSTGYSGYRQKLLELKEQVLEILRNAAEKDSPVFEAMLLGEKTELEQEVKMRYQMAGMIPVSYTHLDKRKYFYKDKR